MALRPFNAPGARLALRTKRASQRFDGARGESEVVLDVSRLLSRAFHPAPTGIDRVEYVYARELLDRMPDRLSFAAVHPAGGYYGRLSSAAVQPEAVGPASRAAMSLDNIPCSQRTRSPPRTSTTPRSLRRKSPAPARTRCACWPPGSAPSGRCSGGRAL